MAISVLASHPSDRNGKCVGSVYHQPVSVLAGLQDDYRQGVDILELISVFPIQQAYFQSKPTKDVAAPANERSCKINFLESQNSRNASIFDAKNSNLESIHFFLRVLVFFKCEITRESKEKPPFWLSKIWPQSLDILLTAAAAQRCHAYLTSILFLEVWCEKQFGSCIMLHDDRSQLSTDLFLKAYANINEPDSILGISHPFDGAVQIRNYEHEENWQKAMDCYDQSLQRSTSLDPQIVAPSFVGMTHALQRSGYGHLANNYLNGVIQGHPQIALLLRETQHEMQWRNQATTLDDSNKLSQYVLRNNIGFQRSDCSFHWGIQQCLTAFARADEASLEFYLKETRLNLLLNLQTISAEGTLHIYPVLSKLLLLSQVDSSWNLRQISNQGKDFTRLAEEEMTQWRKHLALIQGNSFDLIEPLLTLRSALLALSKRNEDRLTHLTSIAHLARRAHRFQYSANTTQLIRECSLPSNDLWNNNCCTANSPSKFRPS